MDIIVSREALQVGCDCLVFCKIEVLWQYAHLPAHLDWQRGESCSQHVHLALGWLHQPLQAGQQGAFAGGGWAEERDGLSLKNLQRDIMKESSPLLYKGCLMKFDRLWAHLLAERSSKIACRIVSHDFSSPGGFLA